MQQGAPMYCPTCGTQNDDNNFRCTNCSEVLHPSAPTAGGPRPEIAPVLPGLPGLIPYRNPSALAAYYLAVFSVIPFLGIFLGIPAFFLGLQGRRAAQQNPHLRGSVHAWVGIIVGGVFGFGYLLLTIALVLLALLG